MRTNEMLMLPRLHLHPASLSTTQIHKMNADWLPGWRHHHHHQPVTERNCKQI